MEKRVKCSRAGDKECPDRACSHRKPHVSTECGVWEDCHNLQGHFVFRVRCVAVKPRKKARG